MTNTEKILSLLHQCLQSSIPLDKASLELSPWSDKPSLTFDARKLTRTELQALKRVCDFEVKGEATSGTKALVGLTKAEPKLSIRVEQALVCTKVVYEDLSAADAERVLDSFRQGKAFLMDCEPATGLEEGDHPRPMGVEL